MGLSCIGRLLHCIRIQKAEKFRILIKPVFAGSSRCRSSTVSRPPRAADTSTTSQGCTQCLRRDIRLPLPLPPPIPPSLPPPCIRPCFLLFFSPFFFSPVRVLIPDKAFFKGLHISSLLQLAYIVLDMVIKSIIDKIKKNNKTGINIKNFQVRYR